MNVLEKLITVTFLTIGAALVLTNPRGTTSAGNALANIYQSVVGSFFKAGTTSG